MAPKTPGESLFTSKFNLIYTNVLDYFAVLQIVFKKINNFLSTLKADIILSTKSRKLNFKFVNWQICFDDWFEEIFHFWVFIVLIILVSFVSEVLLDDLKRSCYKRLEANFAICFLGIFGVLDDNPVPALVV